MKAGLPPRTVFASLGLALLISAGFTAGVSTAYADDAFDTHKRDREAALARCNGAFKGRQPTEPEWAQVLERHREWLRQYGFGPQMHSQQARSDPRRANLCGAILRNLRAARLDGANLSAANLGHADVSEAALWGADLSYIFATRAVFSKAYMNTGSLAGAWLQGANLGDTILAYMNLRGAFLLDTNLRHANIAAADLAGVVFEPEPGALPQFWTLVRAKNLKELRFNLSPHGLVELRQSLKTAGLRSHEREVTYAIRHNERLKAPALERFFSYVLFEMTTEWGLVPSRALRILALLIVLFTLPYAVALRVGGRDGIWRVWTEPRLRTDLGQGALVPLRVGWLAAVRLGLYFSLLSAFHVGWREFNVGNWIARIQPGEYT